jgi:hypothetical protein
VHKLGSLVLERIALHAGSHDNPLAADKILGFGSFPTRLYRIDLLSLVRLHPLPLAAHSLPACLRYQVLPLAAKWQTVRRQQYRPEPVG